ncbi:MAG: hypothetical protein H7A21_00405 [Spirochaetales bacterium]|nr:hypothetical protein [Leptospiraceae bacterium]MCP5479871.1 hypothetical protein [Spirochaetales bacterium]MCP5486261.1 hypothetical protein [Spirochaetales bacterium]
MTTLMRFASLVLLFVLSACLSPGSVDLSLFPEDRRTLFLHNFTNESFQPDVNQELNEWVRRELERRENFRLTTEKDDAALWLYGEITLYRKEGRMFDNLRSPVRVELIVGCRVRLRQHGQGDAGEGLVLVSRELGSRTEYSESEGFRESEFEARQRLLQDLAAQINNALEQGYARALAAPG